MREIFPQALASPDRAPYDGRMTLVAHETLRKLARETLAAAGSGPEEAAIVADHLVEANLRGHDSHGVGLLPMYLRDRAAGWVRTNQHARLVRDEGAIAIFDGGVGYGHVIAREATEWGIARARRDGSVILALRNAYHVARVGTYGQMACDAGLVSIFFVNVATGAPKVAPFGGRDGRLNTNPICIGVPAGDGHPELLLDFATSRIAAGKVRVARNEGHALPEGILIDEHGAPTSDPGVIYREPAGAILPFGEHKGTGLALMCDLLAGALVGGRVNDLAMPPDARITNSMLAILIDPGRLTDLGEFHRTITESIRNVLASPPIDPAKPVMVAGEPERRKRAARIESGIPIDPVTWQEIVAAAKSVGVDADRS